MAGPAGDRVTGGVVGTAIGLKGEAFVRPDPDVAHAFEAGHRYPTGEGDLVVASTRLHSGRRVVRFDGVEDRTAAEGLRGTVLTVPRAEVELDDESYWSDDLIGREVVDDSGALIGVIEETRDGAAHDYIVVARPDAGEVLIPAVSDLIEIEDEHVILHAIPGLIDDDSF